MNALLAGRQWNATVVIPVSIPGSLYTSTRRDVMLLAARLPTVGQTWESLSQRSDFVLEMCNVPRTY